jgi:hypothetical protein
VTPEQGFTHWLKNKPKGPFQDEPEKDDTEEERQEYQDPLTMDEQAREYGVSSQFYKQVRPT